MTVVVLGDLYRGGDELSKFDLYMSIMEKNYDTVESVMEDYIDLDLHSINEDEIVEDDYNRLIEEPETAQPNLDLSVLDGDFSGNNSSSKNNSITNNDMGGDLFDLSGDTSSSNLEFDGFTAGGIAGETGNEEKEEKNEEQNRYIALIKQIEALKSRISIVLSRTKNDKLDLIQKSIVRLSSAVSSTGVDIFNIPEDELIEINDELEDLIRDLSQTTLNILYDMELETDGQ